LRQPGRGLQELVIHATNVTAAQRGLTRRAEVAQQKTRALAYLIIMRGAKMDASFHLRPGTYDAAIYRTVVTENEYRLPESFSPSDRILDIGSHIGAFAYAALIRGSQYVYAVEVDEENYRQSLRNLAPFLHLNHVGVLHKGVWRSDMDESSVMFTGYYQESFSTDRINTGGGSIAMLPIPGCQYIAGTAARSATITFDNLVQQVTDNGEKRIRLLKLDCEGSEWPILLTSRKLHLIDEICGEYHEMGGHLIERQPTFTIPGYTEYTVEVLVRFLQAQGFQLDHYPHGRPDEALGMFFAKRSLDASAL
jgi:FkbM family methyltransferase